MFTTSAGFLLENGDEEVVTNLRNVRRSLRDLSNPLDLPESKFISYFRLSKEAFKYIFDEVKDAYPPKVRSSSISPILKVAATFSFLGHGSYQQATGMDFNLGLAQTTVSECLKETIDILELIICPKWITFKMTDQEKNECKEHFYSKSGFPGIIGCVDGSHIKVISPRDNKELFFNRKGFFSINAMFICDHRTIIRAVDAKHGGASHDALVWRLGDAKSTLKEEYERGERNSWLLGDSGYPLEPWLMTPFRAATEMSRKSCYNQKHSVGRNIIERTIGILKSRFRCLSDAREMHYKPLKATKIINVCSALHNICIHYKVEQRDEMQIQNAQPTNLELEPTASVDEVAGQIRENILNSIT